MKHTILPIFVLLWICGTLFATEPRSVFEDKFDTKVGDGWAWLRENTKAWRIRNGGLEIRVEPGLAHNVKNALLRQRQTVVRELCRRGDHHLHDAPDEPIRASGYYLVPEGYACLKLVHEHIDGKDYIIPGKVPAPEKTVRLRLLVTKDKYTAQFQPGPKGEFKTVASGDLAPGAEEQVSIQCYNGPANAEHWMQFTGFRIEEVK